MDDINKPEWYANYNYEPIDVIKDWDLNFNLGNVVKYIARLGRKLSDPNLTVNEHILKDLKKARVYLNHEISAIHIVTDNFM